MNKSEIIHSILWLIFVVFIIIVYDNINETRNIAKSHGLIQCD